ncbi:MAG TPA: hypothetical protein VFH63_11700 [candidate division Zixibacteria bacterium]|nr:hypothetical protein [candidate division Zixibacteria bacterium]
MNVQHTAPAAGGTSYRPGVCNIGPAEIAARRRTGHVGLAATVVLLVVLLAIGANPIWRLLLFVPAAVGASGYLQAAFRFCAGFGWQGVFNFGDRLRDTTPVEDAEARAADRRRALQISGLSALVGVVTVLLALLI